MNKAQRNRIIDLQADLSEQQTMLVELRENLPLEGYLDTIKNIAGALNDIKTDAEEIKEEESEKYENMAESLKGGERGAALENAVTEMESAVDTLQLAIDELEELTADSERGSVTDSLTTAENYLSELDGNLDNAAV